MDTYEVKAFATPKAFGLWLKKHHAKAPGLWVHFYKKDSGVKSLTYKEALDEALCWGWIDGQAKPFDGQSWVQRYTPRRSRSGWSKRNQDHVARLEKEGRLQAPGRAQVEAAKADGRWEKAYGGQRDSAVPDDFVQAVGKHKKAAAFFKGLDRANLFAIYHRLHTAKTPETRARRFARLLQMMMDGEKLH